MTDYAVTCAVTDAYPTAEHVLASDLLPGDVLILVSGHRSRIRKVYRHGTSDVLIIAHHSGKLERFRTSERVYRMPLDG